MASSAAHHGHEGCVEPQQVSRRGRSSRCTRRRRRRSTNRGRSRRTLARVQHPGEGLHRCSDSSTANLKSFTCTSWWRDSRSPTGSIAFGISTISTARYSMRGVRRIPERPNRGTPRGWRGQRSRAAGQGAGASNSGSTGGGRSRREQQVDRVDGVPSRGTPLHLPRNLHGFQGTDLVIIKVLHGSWLKAGDSLLHTLADKLALRQQDGGTGNMQRFRDEACIMARLATGIRACRESSASTGVAGASEEIIVKGSMKELS